MKQLITKYDAGWKDRLAAIARAIPAEGAAPAFAYAVNSVKVLPPVRPSVILNAGGNYIGAHRRASRRSSSGRARLPSQRPRRPTAPGIWERKPDDTRDNPYLFQKVADRGRRRQRSDRRCRGDATNIDFECEFDAVIGKPAKYVPVDRPLDYIFGYTAQMTSRIAAAAAIARWAAPTG